MRTLIFTDLHSISPLFLLERAKARGVDRFVSLGDLDRPYILAQLRNFPMEKILVMGNHDERLASGQMVSSEDLDSNPQEYIELWKSNPEQAKFVLESSKIGIKRPGRKRGIRVVERNLDGKLCYVHGALIDDYERLNNHHPFLWGRILEEPPEENARLNFGEMDKLDYWILFRGHDHRRKVFSTAIGKGKHLTIVKEEDPNKENELTLLPERRYIVSVGRLDNGSYALYDDKTRVLKFGTCE